MPGVGVQQTPPPGQVRVQHPECVGLLAGRRGPPGQGEVGALYFPLLCTSWVAEVGPDLIRSRNF